MLSPSWNRKELVKDGINILGAAGTVQVTDQVWQAIRQSYGLVNMLKQCSGLDTL
jgi:hypothetical protein